MEDIMDMEGKTLEETVKAVEDKNEGDKRVKVSLSPHHVKTLPTPPSFVPFLSLP